MIVYLKEDTTTRGRKTLYRAYDDVSAHLLKPDFVFNSRKTMSHVSNNEKWEQLTMIQTTNQESKAFAGSSLICTSESES
jgi:hypothetical protein